MADLSLVRVFGVLLVLSATYAFEVYWNIPSFMCKRFNLPIENITRQYGIIQNEFDEFRGDKVAILYDPGYFPAILQNSTSKKFVYRNHGVPQEGNILEHLRIFEDHVNELIPDENFSGLSVIDFESWRPIYRQNFGTLQPYRDLSMKVEKNDHPLWPQRRLEKEAKTRFEAAGKDFMLETLLLGQRMRPNASWGYYAFPYCFNGRSSTGSAEKCASGVEKENNAIQWLFESSDVIFPSVYLSESIQAQNRVPMVRGRVKQAIRVANQVKNKSKPKVLVYHRYLYTDTQRYVDELITYSVLHEIKNSGADGIILWGSSNDLNSKAKCEKFYNYLTLTLGPVVHSLRPAYSIKVPDSGSD